MKKHVLVAIAALACAFAAGSGAQAQTALFIYDDGSGVPNAGTYTPGSTFTFSINLAFTPGGSIANLDGLSYWFQQTNPSIAPFPFSITLRDPSSSIFNSLQSPGLTYPQNLNPVTANDLGGFIASGPGVGAGTYFVADITMSIPLSAPTSGTFTISNTFSGGKTSVISDSFGHTFAIPEADYFITMIPEPATWITPVLGAVALLILQRRRIVKAFPAR
jgi:hypothetical protein